ncbi:MAG: homoserine kinase [Pseudomonadota bacterium]
MNIATRITEQELSPWLEQFDVGRLTDLRQISTGIENSNYYVDTDNPQGTRHFVLTVLEQQYASRDLLVPLTHRLHAAGLPVPAILRTRRGDSITRLLGKQALLSACLPGEHPLNPTRSQCAAVGRFLARFHRAAEGAREQAQLFARDLNWLRRNATQVRSFLPQSEQKLLDDSVKLLESLLDRRDLTRLPIGIVHGDLFRDNVLFNSHGLSGVLDFHHAGEHYLLYDVAVAMNEWCAEGGGRLDAEHAYALLRGYCSERALRDEELWFLPIFLVYAALAFWLSRLAVRYPPQETPPPRQKNPDEFRDILRERVRRFFYVDRRRL